MTHPNPLTPAEVESIHAAANDQNVSGHDQSRINNNTVCRLLSTISARDAELARLRKVDGDVRDQVADILRACKDRAEDNEDSATAILSHLTSLGFARMPEREWLAISEARPNRDGSPNYDAIIYLARDPKPLRNPYYGGFAVWHTADEGLEEGWWDDSITQYVEPIGFMPLPDPKEANLG